MAAPRLLLLFDILRELRERDAHAPPFGGHARRIAPSRSHGEGSNRAPYRRAISLHSEMNLSTPMVSISDSVPPVHAGNPHPKTDPTSASLASAITPSSRQCTVSSAWM